MKSLNKTACFTTQRAKDKLSTLKKCATLPKAVQWSAKVRGMISMKMNQKRGLTKA